MKLSEAIREGAKLRPQAKRGFFIIKAREKVLCSCALGAAFEAVTGTVVRHAPDHIRSELKIHFPQLLDIIKEGAAKWVLGDLIATKNDFREESRETIADWLEAQGY